MQDFMKYYLNNEKLSSLYEGGNERVKTYLSLIFERSYNLFVLHGKKIAKIFLSKSVMPSLSYPQRI